MLSETEDELKGRQSQEVKSFLLDLYQFMRERATPIEKIPHLGFKQIDLWLLYQTVQDLGGYEEVTAKQLWKLVYNKLGGNPRSTSAATCTRRHYEKLLLPYECHVHGKADKPLVLTKLPKRPKRGLYNENIANIPSDMKKTRTEEISHKVSLESAANSQQRYANNTDTENHILRLTDYQRWQDKIATSVRPNSLISNASAMWDTSRLKQSTSSQFAVVYPKDMQDSRPLQELELLRHLAREYSSSARQDEPLNLSVKEKCSPPTAVQDSVSDSANAQCTKAPKFLNQVSPLYAPKGLMNLSNKVKTNISLEKIELMKNTKEVQTAGVQHPLMTFTADYFMPSCSVKETASSPPVNKHVNKLIVSCQNSVMDEEQVQLTTSCSCSRTQSLEDQNDNSCCSTAVKTADDNLQSPLSSSTEKPSHPVDLSKKYNNIKIIHSGDPNISYSALEDWYQFKKKYYNLNTPIGPLMPNEREQESNEHVTQNKELWHRRNGHILSTDEVNDLRKSADISKCEPNLYAVNSQGPRGHSDETSKTIYPIKPTPEFPFRSKPLTHFTCNSHQGAVIGKRDLVSFGSNVHQQPNISPSSLQAEGIQFTENCRSEQNQLLNARIATHSMKELFASSTSQSVYLAQEIPKNTFQQKYRTELESGCCSEEFCPLVMRQLSHVQETNESSKEMLYPTNFSLKHIPRESHSAHRTAELPISRQQINHIPPHINHKCSSQLQSMLNPSFLLSLPQDELVKLQRLIASLPVDSSYNFSQQTAKL
ncbi:uncharacterized protein LOC122795707 [Protopterus annectens]|uniref:uncharacterized protein LOC122795707 n=1 Tax=Protopterus annectens TaxID=7888 RepID=UPI001CF94736|nr:uncharacterized protein LOC122795707 [Protopterus annectens]